MSEYILKPVFSLGKATAQVDKFRGLTLRENADLALVSLAARAAGKEHLAEIAKTHFGCELPEPGMRVEGRNGAVFWTGPMQWFFEADRTEGNDLAGSLKAAFGERGSLTDQSDGWGVFDIEGPNVLPMLERLCQLDIHRFKSGSAARTVIEHIGVFVIRLRDNQWRILGARSSANSLHHALCTAARSVG